VGGEEEGEANGKGTGREEEGKRVEEERREWEGPGPHIFSPGTAPVSLTAQTV